MKYLVMELNEGYAVLMREDAVFVKAADLHYEVGQTVTDPVLMEAGNRISSAAYRTVIKIAAAAACILLTVFSGYQFYSRNMTDRIVISSAAADIEIHLNKSGSVVALTSSTPEGKEIIKQYNEQNIKLKDSANVANELLAIQIRSGYISSGDTIDLIVDTENSGDSYRNDIEKEIAKLDLKVSGSSTDETPKSPAIGNAADEKHAPDSKKEDAALPEPPKPAEKEKLPAAEIPQPKQNSEADKLIPPTEQHTGPEAPAEPPVPPTPEKPEEHREADITKPDDPVPPPNKDEMPVTEVRPDGPPEAPKPEEKHDEKPPEPISPAGPSENITPLPAAPPKP